MITSGETSQVSKPHLDLTNKKNWLRIKWWPDDDGGSEITSFDVRVKKSDDSYAEPTNCADLTYLDDACFVDIQVLHAAIADSGFGYAWGDVVKFQVKAHNDKGDSGWSEDLGDAVIYYKPKAPTAVGDTADLRADEFIQVTFTETPIADWNGADVYEYELYRYQEGNG